MEKYLKMKNPQNFEIDRNSKKTIKNFPKTKKENIKQNEINNSKHSKTNTYMKKEFFLITYIFHNIFNLFLFKILLFMNLFMPAFLQYTIKVTLVNSGSAGKIINDLYMPDEMLIGNDTIENSITPNGEIVTLNWNSTFPECSNMFNAENTIAPIIQKIDFINYICEGSMENMFANQINLESITFSEISTRSVSNMSGMLKNCKSLASISLSLIDFSSANNMEFMFNGCEKLTSIMLPKKAYIFNEGLSMSNMFSYCKSLISIDLSTFTIKTNSDMNCMFCFDDSLVTVELPKTSISK